MGTNNRLLSLDVLRGITIAGMILVNNPGSWSYIYAPLAHANWNGLTPTDLVFPFFMFIMGISTYISLKKYQFRHNFATLQKILKRVSVIFLIGVGIAWLSLFFRIYHDSGELPFWQRLGTAAWNFENIRILGVMQRLALTYGATALIAIFIRHKYIPYGAGGILFLYFFILYFGNGFEKSGNNIISIIDRAILGVNHMYKDGGIALDPEGLLSTIPSVCHVLIGFYCGKMTLETNDNFKRILRLFIFGTILTFSGFLLSYGCPINKKIWSPTFVLTTCGLGASFLALLIWIVDCKGYKKWSLFFESFGVNPLFIYVAAGVISILIRSIYFTYSGESVNIQKYVYSIILQPVLGDYFGSFVFALGFITICWLIGYILYKKKIFIKI
ncbi:MAG: heparan-alpha-glucosaminide N-acetyltransferase domain-containing protein [Flavobacteriaceae bacterium]|jgi:predicted acyltransferase|nr:heparan-alpha-glucosaminide N-acetyltransferase domain-containing protein [Flavobacteriaceae bacterium]